MVRRGILNPALELRSCPWRDGEHEYHSTFEWDIPFYRSDNVEITIGLCIQNNNMIIGQMRTEYKEPFYRDDLLYGTDGINQSSEDFLLEPHLISITFIR